MVSDAMWSMQYHVQWIMKIATRMYSFPWSINIEYFYVILDVLFKSCKNMVTSEGSL